MTSPILVTGFDPFDKWESNPSRTLALDLAARPPAGLAIESLVLPSSYRRAPGLLAARLVAGLPSALILLGLAGKRSELCLERVALNLADADLPDNDGVLLQETPLEPAGPPACFARFPLRPALARLAAAGLPARISLSAGAFVCNAVYYRAARLLTAAAAPPVPFVFVHLPPSEAEAALADPGVGPLPLERARHALEIVIATALEQPRP